MRLIDADALINELNNSHYPGAPYIDAGISIAIGKVCDAPTIDPEPQVRMAFGYSMEYLVAFAEACRRAGVDESDLKTFANNCTFAYTTMAEEYRQNINHVIDAFMGNVGGMNERDCEGHEDA